MEYYATNNEDDNTKNRNAGTVNKKPTLSSFRSVSEQQATLRQTASGGAVASNHQGSPQRSPDSSACTAYSSPSSTASSGELQQQGAFGFSSSSSSSTDLKDNLPPQHPDHHHHHLHHPHHFPHHHPIHHHHDQSPPGHHQPLLPLHYYSSSSSSSSTQSSVRNSNPQQESQQLSYHHHHHDTTEQQQQPQDLITRGGSSSRTSSTSSPPPHTGGVQQPTPSLTILQHQQSNNSSDSASSTAANRAASSRMDLDDSADSDYSSNSQPDYPAASNVEGGKVKLEAVEDIEKLKNDLLRFQWSMDKMHPELAGQPGALDKFKSDLLKPGAFEKLYENFHKHPSIQETKEDQYSDQPSSSCTEPDQIPFVGSTVPSTLPQDFHDLKYKSSKPTKDKLCLVCSDKALGYNFNAVSCESCKAFFRRNAFKEIRGRCEGQCDVTVESRSYCKKCRLAKCFAVGMKRELILNDTQKHIRRQKIHENRLRRQGLPVTNLPPAPSGGEPSQGSPSGSSVSSEGSTLTHVIAAEVDPHAYDDMSEEAKDKIIEVKKAFALSFDSPVTYDPKETPSGTDFLNMADASVRRLVKMAKHLDTFRQLDQEDQITLLKGAVVEVLILRSSKMFDSTQMSWQLQSKEGEQKKVSAMAFQFGNGENMQFFQQYQRFTTTLLSVTKRDNIILMLIIVMTVLSPDRVNIKVKESISAAQEQYARILKEYCEKKYPKEKLMFAKIIQKLADIRDINETHTKMLMHMKVDELGPLIVEIFNLSSR